MDSEASPWSNGAGLAAQPHPDRVLAVDQPRDRHDSGLKIRDDAQAADLCASARDTQLEAVDAVDAAARVVLANRSFE